MSPKISEVSKSEDKSTKIPEIKGVEVYDFLLFHFSKTHGLFFIFLRSFRTLNI